MHLEENKELICCLHDEHCPYFLKKKHLMPSTFFLSEKGLRKVKNLECCPMLQKQLVGETFKWLNILIDSK